MRTHINDVISCVVRLDTRLAGPDREDLKLHHKSCTECQAGKLAVFIIFLALVNRQVHACNSNSVPWQILVTL